MNKFLTVSPFDELFEDLRLVSCGLHTTEVGIGLCNFHFLINFESGSVALLFDSKLELEIDDLRFSFIVEDEEDFLSILEGISNHELMIFSKNCSRKMLNLGTPYWVFLH